MARAEKCYICGKLMLDWYNVKNLDAPGVPDEKKEAYNKRKMNCRKDLPAPTVYICDSCFKEKLEPYIGMEDYSYRPQPKFDGKFY